MIRFFTFLACTCLLWACFSDGNEGERPRILPDKVAQEDEKPYDSRCIFKRDAKKRMDNMHPFNKATKIEAIEFDLRKYAEELRTQLSRTKKRPSGREDEPVSIENGTLFVPYVTHRAFLTEEQHQKLFETLFFNHGESSEIVKCYEPNHVLVFYEGETPFAFLELCFSCNGWRNYQTKFKDFCDEKWQTLETFFPQPMKKY